METLFVVLSLNVQKESSEEIWTLHWFFTVSLFTGVSPTTPIKYLSFLGFKNVNSVSRIWAQHNGD